MTLYELASLFLIYSFLGWCVEVCFVAVTHGQVVNRGFLNGPVCPIYGVGMLGVLLLLTPVADNYLLLFVGGMAICTAIELAGGWILERVFDTRWWDYSEEPFNLGGYICLRFSILWGLAVTFAVHLVHPAVLRCVDLLPQRPGLVLLVILYALFLLDLVATLVTIIGLKRRLRELDRITQGLHTVGDALSNRLGTHALAADAKLDELRETGQEKAAKQRERVSGLMSAGQERAAADRQKLEGLVLETLEELHARREALEQRQRELREKARNAFGVQRLRRAFPDVWMRLRSHLGDSDGNE